MRPSFLGALAIPAFLSVASPVFGAGPPAESLALPTEEVLLPNGLHVLLAPDPNARLVSVQVRYAVGSADDPNGRRGLAHLVEHVIASKTMHVDRALSVLEGAGATEFNATTRPDETFYFETLPPERLETALWVESDRMGFSAVDETVVREEREVIRNEDRDRRVDGMLAEVGVAMNHELYPSWHPYSSYAEGAADLDRIVLDDVRAFVRTWYSPTNATLAIAGRFDRDKALALVDRYFSSLPRRLPPARPELPPADERSVMLAVRAPTGADEVFVAWRTPAFGAQDDTALDLAARVLSGAGNDYFERALVAKHLATRAWAWEQSYRRESVFRVEAVAAPGVNPGYLADRIQDMLDAFARDVTAVQVDRARREMRRSMVRQLETTDGRVDQLSALLDLGIPLGPRCEWERARYERLHPDDVKRAVARWLTLGRRVVTVVLNNSSSPRRGAAVLREEVAQ